MEGVLAAENYKTSQVIVGKEFWAGANEKIVRTLVDTIFALINIVFFEKRTNV